MIKGTLKYFITEYDNIEFVELKIGESTVSIDFNIKGSAYLIRKFKDDIFSLKYLTENCLYLVL